ncbi:DMT family transporter [Kiloniella sp.]|uniref:DMT family transporter n=1 Tax=Kiloniella sp. TaxID=1938587 RepID=UPI003B019F69
MKPADVVQKTKKVPLIGMMTGLIGGAAFGLITPISPLANEAGSTPVMITFIRFVLGLGLMGLIIFVGRCPLHVPRNKWLPLSAMGLFIFTVTVFYLSAVVYIPVSLAAILFYTYPIIVTILDPLLQRRLPSVAQLALSLLAFSGIAVALGPSIDALDWRGIGFVALAALSISGTLIISRKVVSEVNNLTIVFYVNIIGLVLSVPYLLLSDGIDLPAINFETVANLKYPALIAGLYLLATLAQIITVRFVGPSRTAMFFNVEPIVTILAAVAILHESLTHLQITGSVLVLSAVVISCCRPVRI